MGVVVLEEVGGKGRRILVLLVEEDEVAKAVERRTGVARTAQAVRRRWQRLPKVGESDSRASDVEDVDEPEQQEPETAQGAVEQMQQVLDQVLSGNRGDPAHDQSESEHVQSLVKRMLL